MLYFSLGGLLIISPHQPLPLCLFCIRKVQIYIIYLAGAFAVFFNRVWEKKRESEAAYAEHLMTFSDTLPRKKHDPLPEVPPSPHDRRPNRYRSLSARHYESPTLITREIHSSSGSLNARPTPSLEVSLRLIRMLVTIVLFIE